MTKRQICERLCNVTRQFKLAACDDKNISFIFNLIEDDAPMGHIAQKIHGAKWSELAIKEAVLAAFNSPKRRTRLSGRDLETLILVSEFAQLTDVRHLLIAIAEGDIEYAKNALRNMAHIEHGDQRFRARSHR